MKMITRVTSPNRSAARLVVLAAWVAACGNGDPPMTSAGGGAGASTTASGGSAGGGAGGSAGAGGGANPVDVTNPSLPRPSYDCRTDQASSMCVSMSGTVAGTPVDLHCALATPPGGFLLTPKRWIATCSDSPDSTMGNFYRASIPVQAPGIFHYTVHPGDAFVGAEFTVAKDGAGGDSSSPHFAGAELAGRVEKAPGTGYDVISGTYRSTWRMPTAGQSCLGLTQTCAAADVTGSFRVVYSLPSGVP